MGGVGEELRRVMIKREQRRRNFEIKRSRRIFEAEARRQSLVLADAARDPNSDEAAIMRELDALWDDLCRDIEAEEAKN